MSNFQKIFFGEVLDLYQLPHERNFEYLEKNGVLKFLEQAFRPGNFSGSCTMIHEWAQQKINKKYYNYQVLVKDYKYYSSQLVEGYLGSSIDKLVKFWVMLRKIQ